MMEPRKTDTARKLAAYLKNESGCEFTLIADGHDEERIVKIQLSPGQESYIMTWNENGKELYAILTMLEDGLVIDQGEVTEMGLDYLAEY